MRRTLVGRSLFAQTGREAGSAKAFPQRSELGADASELFAKLEHHLILLGDVMLQMSNFLFEMADVFVHVLVIGGTVPDEACARSFSNSGMTTRL